MIDETYRGVIINIFKVIFSSNSSSKKLKNNLDIHFHEQFHS